MRHVWTAAAILTVTGATCALDAPPARVAAEAVKVRVERKTYPVVHPARKPAGATELAAKLHGKTEYTTDLVILENEYLEVHVLPELGGRLVRAVFTPGEHTGGSSGEQLFWEMDEIRDGRSWSMGGGRWSFPFWEHGRHFDETGGYAIVRDANSGAVTLAIDMRFDDYLKAEETGRYGRATNLRLVQFVTLRPGEAKFDWTARVENPLPIRYGFKLWWLLRQPAVEGVQIILPAAAVTGHGAPGLQKWDANTEVRTLNTSVFAVGMQHDFAGWYFPKRDLNVLRVQDHRTAPGAKQVIYPPSAKGYIEMWGGSHELFEECGRLLPAFGAYDMKVTVLPASGIGRADYANEHAAVSCKRTDKGWDVKVVPTRRLAKLAVFTDQDKPTGPDSGEGVGNGETPSPASPDRPRKVSVPHLSERIRVMVKDGNDVLVDQVFPIDVGPMPAKAFALLQSRVNATMPGGKLLYAEATDLVSEHGLSLPKALGLIEKTLRDGNAAEKLTAARLLMRLKKNDPRVKEVVESYNTEHTSYPAAWTYRALFDSEANEFGVGCWPEMLRGGEYVRLLALMADKSYSNVVKETQELLEGKWGRDFEKGDPATALLQQGSYVSATRPRLLMALALEAQGKTDAADKVLRGMLAKDPALIEAWMLLAARGDKQAKEQLRTLTEHNESGKRAAEKVLDDLRSGKWAGIGRP